MTTRRVVAVFGSSRTVPRSRDWAEAESLGAGIAGAGLAVTTGGYGGTMEAVSKGASEAGGHVVGVTAPTLFPDRSGANEYVAALIEADDLLSRIAAIIEPAAGVIALPGSIGTATELLISWNHNFLARQNGQEILPTVAVGEGWRAVTRTMLDRVGAEPGDIHLTDSAGDALEWLLDNM